MSSRGLIGVVIGVFLIVPIAIDAGVSSKANPQCALWNPELPCVCHKGIKVITDPQTGTKTCPGTGNTAGCPVGICKDTMPDGKKVDGICVAAGKCEGKKFTNQKGQQQDVAGDQGGGQGGDEKGKGGGEGQAGMMEGLKGILEAVKGMMKGGGGGGGGGQPPPGGGGQPGGQQIGQPGGHDLNNRLGSECLQRYQVTVPSTDPCAYFVPKTSESLLPPGKLPGIPELPENIEKRDPINPGDTGKGRDADRTFLDDDEDDGSGSGAGVSGKLLEDLPVRDSKNKDERVDTKSPPSGAKRTDPPGVDWRRLNITPGTRGDIEVTDTGATILAGARDVEANTEVVGFYGSDVPDAPPQGAVTRLCRNRPWSGSVVSLVIPPSFFDSLCAWRGYQVGTPNPPSQPIVNQKIRIIRTDTAIKATTSEVQLLSVPAQVDIWSVPENVPLGSRVSVFWNTKGVESCSIKSPDGSFNENSLSGGAATVPLTGPTTFTISCLTADGKPVTDYVTVLISI